MSFFSWIQTGGEVFDAARVEFPPVLAVEVWSPGNRPGEMQTKRTEYFGGGSRLVWELEPHERRVLVYTAVHDFTALRDGDTLAGGEVLPGFEVPVTTLLTRPTPRPPER